MRPTLGMSFVLACIALMASACVTVKPSERQLLSKPEMTPGADAEEDRSYSHVEQARHGSMSGHGGAGGGCGCG